MDDATILFARVTSCYPSFAKGGRRVIRMGQRGQRGHAPTVTLEGKVVNLVPPGVRWDASHVYLYQISPDLRERWPKQPARQYVVCLTDDGVESYLKQRFGNIARKNMGAAKLALGIAAAQTSTRPMKQANPGKNAKRTAGRCVEVRIVDSGEVYTVSISDTLSYAVSAVDGGPSAIDIAVKKAANRVAGMLRSKAAAPLKDQLRTPFPEVARRK